MLLGLVALGCGPTCYDDYVNPNFRVSVTDAQTGERICDAEVSINGEAAFAYERDCDYARDIPSGETAELTVSKAGYQVLVQQLSTSYELDECDKAISKRIAVKLQRE